LFSKQVKENKLYIFLLYKEYASVLVQSKSRSAFFANYMNNSVDYLKKNMN